VLVAVGAGATVVVVVVGEGAIFTGGFTVGEGEGPRPVAEGATTGRGRTVRVA
jgi:hypothetical protein